MCVDLKKVIFYEISKKASLRAKESFMSYVVTTVYILYPSCLQKYHREEVLSKEVLCQEVLSKEMLCQEQKRSLACLCMFFWIII